MHNLSTAAAAGFDTILPLIPVDGQLYPGGTDHDGSTIPATSIPPEARGKVPGSLIGNYWTGLPGWTDYQITPDEIARHDAMGANCGLRMGEHWVGVDLDSTDPDLAQVWVNTVLQHWPRAMIRVGLSPKSLIVFRVSGPPIPSRTIKFTREGQPNQLLEVLDKGKQAVLLGTHPATRAPYQWWYYSGIPAVPPERIVAPTADACVTVDQATLDGLVEALTVAAQQIGWTVGSSSTPGAPDARSSDLNEYKADPEVVAGVLALLPNNLDWDGWSRIGLAIKHELGPDGWPVFREFSSRWASSDPAKAYDEKVTARLWNGLRPNGAVGFGTIMKMARDAGVTLPADLEARRKADASARAAQRTIDQHMAIMPPAVPLVPVPAVTATTQPVRLEHTIDLVLNDAGVPVMSTANVHAYLNNQDCWRGVFGYNEMTGKIIVRSHIPGSRVKDLNRSLSDADVRHVLAWFQRHLFPKIPITDVRNAIYLAADDFPFDPLADYLNALVWDGIPRIGSWLTNYAGVEAGPYTSQVGRKWLIAAVARALRPGCKVDSALIMEGLQGVGKSTLLRSLCYDERWFGDNLPPFDSKDASAYLAGQWIIEMAELTALRRSDRESMRAFLTRQIDEFRKPYATETMEHPRRCVFAGTTNRDDYLTDVEGERRFWIVKCSGQSEIAGLVAVRDQLWAEAVAAYRANETWFLDPDIAEQARQVQVSRVEQDPWSEVLAPYLIRTQQRRCREVTRKVDETKLRSRDFGLRDQRAQSLVVKVARAEGRLDRFLRFHQTGPDRDARHRLAR